MSQQRELPRRSRSLGARFVALAATVVAASAFAAGPAAASHGEPFGAGFGIADAVDHLGDPVDVFNGPKALWAGVCDTEGRDTTGTGRGTAPLYLIHCVDPDEPYFKLATQTNPDPPIETTWQPGEAPDWRLDMVRQAGAHPDMSLSFWYRRSSHAPVLDGGTGVSAISDGEPKDVVVKLPAGFMGNPTAVPQCPAEAVRTVPPACGPETQVGVAEIALARAGTPTPDGGSVEGSLQRVPIWNVEPRDGKLAEFMLAANINENARVNVPIVARARTDGDFGIDALALDLPTGLPVVAQTITLWGIPFAAAHDKYRAPAQYAAEGNDGIPVTGFPDSVGNQPQGYDPSWGPVRPFFVNPTECAPAPPVTGVSIASWRKPTDFRSFAAAWDAPISGCEKVPFGEAGVSMDLQPTSSAAGGPTGLTADLTVPQAGEAPFDVPQQGASQAEIDQYVGDATAHWKSDDGLSTAQLEKAVVTLPEGVSMNPSSAAGLAGCSDAAFGLQASGPPAIFNNADPFDGDGAECPAGSRIGTVELYTPLLPLVDGEQPGDPNLTGDVVLGMPKSTDPLSGEMLRLFLVVRNARRGLVAKIAGSATANPATGQLTAIFEQSPRVPFETMRLRLKGGQRATLALQQRCESRAWASLLSPWTAAHGQGGLPVTQAGAFTPTANCGHGFTPDLRAGSSDRRGGASGSFSFSLSREDGEQWIDRLTAEMPAGVLAAVGDVPLCTGAQAAAAACPAASRIGTVDAGAGAGAPFFLEKKGAAYLTEGYKGAPYGMAAIVPVEAGPFTGKLALKTMVVRQALRVDPSDASVTIESDPLPQIWHGIPLRVRQLTVRVDRPGFMRNPTDCSPKQIAATVVSTEGARHRSTAPFQASECGRLGFKPRLGLRLTGRRQMKSGGHPGIKAVLTQPSGQANIEATNVRLPKQFVLDSKYETRRGICKFESWANDDLTVKPDPNCPASSAVGRARAYSPLLARPLSGPVYFAENRRLNSFGRSVRTFPALILKLRGEIAVNLRAKTTTVVGKSLITEFPDIPDAPVSRFELSITGGRNGLLMVTQRRNGRKYDLCRARPVAEIDVDGHNGRRADQDARMKLPCKRASKKGARSHRR